MNRDAIAGALAQAAQVIQLGDVVAVTPGGHAIIRRGAYGILPCVSVANDALLLKCIRRVISVRPPIVALHFRSVVLRRRDGGCFADLDGKDVRAYVIMAPGATRVFVYGLD